MKDRPKIKKKLKINSNPMYKLKTNLNKKDQITKRDDQMNSANELRLIQWCHSLVRCTIVAHGAKPNS